MKTTSKNFFSFVVGFSLLTVSLSAETLILDLNKVLELAGAHNIEVNLSQERVEQAKLDHNLSWYNWLPDVRIGGQYAKQDGLLQNTDGSVTLIGNITSFGGAGMGYGMDFNSDDQTMYLTAYDSFTFNNALFSIDITDASTILIGNLSVWTSGLSILTPFIADFESELTITCQDDKAIFANNLFKALREFDREGMDIILVAGVNAKGIGRAVMNRLEKAAVYRVINI